METLYHGSYLVIQHPLALAGRKSLDFGQGFYLTNIKDQAARWAKVVSNRKRSCPSPFLNVYMFDREKAQSLNARFKVFEEYNLEWLDFVVKNRNGNLGGSYDIVEGGVANDNVIDTVEDYANGVITAEQALGQLKYKKVNHQICIQSQSIIDQCLTFIEAMELKNED